MKRLRNWPRWLTRLIFLAAAIFLSIGGPLPAWAGRVLPGLSPLATLADAVAQRRWYLSIFWLLPPLLVLALAVARGRWFCRWVCPAGTVYAIGNHFSLKRHWLRVRISPFILWMTLAAAAVGAPLFLWADPLSTASRTFALLAGVRSVWMLLPGLVLPLFLLLGLIQPMIWCNYFCPLGYSFEILFNLRRPHMLDYSRHRREFLAGLVLGVPAALLLRRIPATKASVNPNTILPPGAIPVAQFGAICSRCYACVQACKYGILTVPYRPGQSLAQIAQPEMNADRGACEQFCHACTQVCPTGAIRALSAEEKQRRRIGLARISRPACLAWEDKQHCMVCQEFCPYGAIDTITSADGIPQPVVNEALCRGCGFCQLNCPAVRAGKAILVAGLARQESIPPPVT